MIKVFPEKKWSDTIAVNKRSHKNVVIPDISQIVQLRFNNLVPIDSIVNDIKIQSFIKYAMGPEEMELCSTPNDPLYSSASHWAFERIKAENAWDITKGSSSVSISINDYFTDTPLHEDLVGKIIYSEGAYENHGGSVAGIAGAMTNNNLGVASLGWNLMLMLHTWGYASVYDAITRGADVINFSWMGSDPYIEDAIHTALLEGVVCVAATGNGEYTPPYILIQQLIILEPMDK